MSRIQIILTLLGAGVAAVNYTVFLVMSRHNSLPIAPIVLCCVFIPVLFCVFFGKFASEHFKVLYEVLKWIYISIGLLYSVSFLLFSVFVTHVPDATEEADVFIVCGCRTFGYTPSYALQRRLDHTYDLLDKNPGSVAVLSGGQGKDETVSEAESMRAYLVNKGVGEERLVLEDRSTSTLENLRFSMEIIKEKGWENKKISAVSNDFHVRRIKKLAQECGYGISVSPARMNSPVRLLQNLTREYMVWISTFVFG
ncbi:MAG: YdcF family protein [Clostridia bacterium]|nr:YdcF family protein [Clostridia bacterium]